MTPPRLSVTTYSMQLRMQVLGDGSYAAVMRVLSPKLGNMSCLAE
jgi:hypothetical protein